MIIGNGAAFVVLDVDNLVAKVCLETSVFRLIETFKILVHHCGLPCECLA